MCGKFTQMASWAEVYEYANLLGASSNDDVKTFTPMRAVPVVHLNEAKDGRLVTPMGWGFTDRSSDRKKRRVRNMHARGETVNSKTTWSDAFRYRRGITWAKTFNEGEEIMVQFDDGTPAGKTWTRQWVFRPRDDKPIILGVIYDVFDVGNGPEYEFVQVTTPANPLVMKVTDRMPLVLREEDIELWLGELPAPIEDVLALIRTCDFNESEWEMFVEDPSKKPPQARKKRPTETDKPRLF